MRVLIKSTTMADGRLVKRGNIEDLSADDAALLIELGKAVPAVSTPVVVEPVTKRRGRKRGAQ